MMDIKKMTAAVDAWANLHRDELVADMIRLINIPSVAQDREACSRAVEYMMELGRRYGFQVEHDEDYSVSVLSPGTDGGRELGILGHIDVVPAGGNWRFAPFDACEQNGWVIGRGSSDNKGPVIMALYVMRCMKELGLEWKSDIRLIAGCREETDMEDVKRYVQQHELPAFTLNCDGAWAACIGEKGILTAELVQDVADGNLLALHGGTASNAVPAEAEAVLAEADEAALKRAQEMCSDVEMTRESEGVRLRMHGVAAHASVPALGVNANIRLIRLLRDSGLLTGDAAVRIDRLCRCFDDDDGTALRINHQDDVSGKTTCVGSMLRLQEGRMTMHINVRFAVTQNSRLLLASLKKRLDKLDIRLEDLQVSPPRYDPPDQPEVQLLVDTCQELLGKRHKPYVMGGGTHSRIFPRSLPFGPADRERKSPFGGAHGADEAVYIDGLLEAIKVYVAALVRLDEYLG